MFEFIAQIFRNMFVFVGMVTTKSSFPPALTPEEEQALLKKLAAGDDDARDKLIEHNLRLVAHIAEKKKNNEVSLDEPLGTDRDGNEITLADVIASAENPIADTAINNSACRAVRSAAQSILDERERIVIEMRYGFANGIAMPQREVGKKLGISRSYVSRIEKRALAKLNSCLSGKHDI